MTLRTILIAGLLVGSLTGCGDDGGDPPPTPMPDADVQMDADVDGTAPANAQIRAFHLSPGTPNVDIFVGDAEPAVITDLAFGASTDYLSVPAGTYNFDVAATGSALADAVLPIDGLELAADTSYTAVAHGQIGNADRPLAALPLVDDQTAPADGNIRVRVVHAAVGLNQVDIWNVTGDTPAELIPDFDYGVATAFLELPAQAYVIGVDTDNDMTPDVTFNIPALDAGTIATVFAVTDADGNPSLMAQLGGATVVPIMPNAAAGM